MNVLYSSQAFLRWFHNQWQWYNHCHCATIFDNFSAFLYIFLNKMDGNDKIGVLRYCGKGCRAIFHQWNTMMMEHNQWQWNSLDNYEFLPMVSAQHGHKPLWIRRAILFLHNVIIYHWLVTLRPMAHLQLCNIWIFANGFSSTWTQITLNKKNNIVPPQCDYLPLVGNI